MRKMFKGSACALALLAQPVWAVEHTDATVFDKQVIHFDQMIDAVSSATPTQGDKYFSIATRSSNSAVFEAKLSSLTMGKIKMADGNIYNRIMLPDGGSPAEPGKPNLTGYRQMVRIPEGAQLDIAIDEVEWSETFSDITVDPVQLPFPDVVTMDGERPDQHMPFVKDEAAYGLLTDSKSPLVTVIETIRVRGKSYAVISYRPIEFNPIEKTVRFAQKVRFHVNYVLPENSQQKAKRKDALDFDAPTDSIIDIRSETTKDSGKDFIPAQPETNSTITPSQAADYLIITADRFRNAIEPLAAWKRKKGYNVYVAPITETGSTQAQIKEYIANAYKKGTMTSYVLFVGDHEDVPAWEIVGHGYHGTDHKWHTDFEYTLVDGSDKYPDLVIGRLPGDTEDQITNMVNRTLNYEKTPFDSDRYSHALLAGQYQDSNNNRKADRMFMEDLHRVADFLGPDYNFFGSPGDLFNKGYQIHTALQWDADLTKELQYGGWDYGSARITPPLTVPQEWKNQGNGNKVQIATAINQGVGLVMHRDHGYADGSGWADPQYTASEVNELVNGNMSPVVFSLNCATGWFDGKDSFAESWMRNPNGGAVGFTGAVRVSYSGYNDLMHAAIMDSFWDDYDGNWSSNIYPVSWRPAMAMNRAKHRLFNHFGAQGLALSTARFFSWFGDPELELRTQRPQELTVTHPTRFTHGSVASFDVTVRSDGELLKDARVALVTVSGESHVATTDQNGLAHFELKTNEAMTLTVTEHNAAAYEGQITVEGNGPKANVQSGQTVEASDWFFLDGRQSVASKGRLRYHWTQTSGQSVTINRAYSSRAWVQTAENITSDETLVFKLTVTDGSGLSHSASHTVVVKAPASTTNLAPVAQADSDQTASFNQWITLNGRQSMDPDGSIESYKWTQIEGPAVRIDYSDNSYAYAATPAFDATLKFQLTVTDNEGKSSSVLQTVVVKDPDVPSNQAPVAHAGSEQTASFNQWIALDGRKSSDSDGSIVSYKWTQIEGPAVRIDHSDGHYAYAAAPAFETTLTFKLTVTDNEGMQSSSTNTIHVK
ncbi:C25 family cysteine peptidase [Photobacterium sp.]|uniref:C25 family cysteine peptidase n=1 Tax=Photobacterium sp. TaxID=660 RepID=UPI00299EE41D|nr:C25 family cysteine peptidase [Photobacterium sp.]MDX1300781.1 C25 family cysteine peptidase [Photobacterium sp.]